MNKFKSPEWKPEIDNAFGYGVIFATIIFLVALFVVALIS